MKLAGDAVGADGSDSDEPAVPAADVCIVPSAFGVPANPTESSESNKAGQRVMAPWTGADQRDTKLECTPFDQPRFHQTI